MCDGLDQHPTADIERVADAQRRFLAAVENLDDAAAASPSPLPGWTMGHVLTHVARNADSHCRRAEAAVRREVVEQYPGGYVGREAEIAAGASRPAADLVEDVRATAERLDEIWASLPDAAWSWASPDVGGVQRSVRDLPSRRWHELEVHVVDLGVGVTHRDWSDDFVACWLPRLRLSLPARLPAGAGLLAPDRLDERDELAWLYGRLRRDDLPSLRGWG
ncbi:MAG: maleylpyruvate isomerase N-terminal domain-containing protein [Acidimicrobiales bacterium]